MLIVLIGVRGAGKTTALNELRARKYDILTPSTTREPRYIGDTEYDYVSAWNTVDYEWEIKVGKYTYGMRKSELEKAKDNVCFTVFDPLNIAVFDSKRDRLGITSMTVGLDTIDNIDEQSARVEGDHSRLMSDKSFRSARKAVQECDAVLTGDERTIVEAITCLVAIFHGRGGVLVKQQIDPLVKAGCLVTGGDIENVKTASYDLRIGNEILCQGKYIELTEAEPTFSIPPYSYAIVSALEHANFPPFIIGRFDLKVSYFFEGIVLSNGPQVDPGYKGALFCMLYNGSDRPKVLTVGKHFATIDFTTTTLLTKGYRQKYQLKQKMHQFITEVSVANRGGLVVEMVDEKVGAVASQVKKIQNNFWAIAAAVIALVVVVPALVIPVAWIEIGNLHTEKLAFEDIRRQMEEDNKAANVKNLDLAALKRTLAQIEKRIGAIEAYNEAATQNKEKPIQ